LQVARGFDVLHEMAAAGAASLARPPAVERARLQALQLARNERLIDAAFCWHIVPLEAPPAPVLRAGGEAIPAAPLLPAHGELRALACCACTLGARLAQRVRELYADGRITIAAELEDLASEMLAAVVRRAHDRVYAAAERQGLCLAGELRSGDAELSAETEAAVVRLAGAERIGVLARDDRGLDPTHSTVLVLGAGVDLPPEDWSRCGDCPKRRICRVIARLRARRLPA
jgi:hypothetical protein